MTKPVVHPMALDGKDPSNLRGDPITAERYYSKEWARREWDQLWTKIWHIAGRTVQLKEPGDYVVHNFMHESVIVARQEDGSIRGFYNACGHRGQRLTWEQEGSQDTFTCPYHGWIWGKDGSLIDVQDPDDFPQGDPCGKLTLKEVRVETCWGLVWYTMNPDAPPLLKYLEPMTEVYKNHMWDERMVRVKWLRVTGLNSNWKFFSDNFNESYHTRTAHPQVPPRIDQDHFTSRYEMYPMGHARIVQLGRPSVRDLAPKGINHPFDALLREWDIDPDSYPDFETKVVQGWLDLKEAKKRLWKERGLYFLENLNDEELTESPFTFIFPNIALGAGAESFTVFRWEPHPDDPEKCIYEHWTMTHPVGKQFRQRSTYHVYEMREAEFEHLEYDGGKGNLDIADNVTYQDMGLSAGQQAGWRSRGYPEPYLAGQETRVRRFHETLHDYLAGNPPKPTGT